MTKVYFYDPSKPSPVPVPSQSINGQMAPYRAVNSTQSMKSDFDKMNIMGPASNEFPQSRSVENFNYQKVLLDAAKHRHHPTQDTTRNTQIKNIETHETAKLTHNMANQQIVLMSPVFGQSGHKSFLLSPMHDPRTDPTSPSKFVLVPLEPIENIDVQVPTPLDSNTHTPNTSQGQRKGEREISSNLSVRTPVHTAGPDTDRQTDIDCAASNSYSLYLQQNNLTSYQQPTSRYKQWNMMVRMLLYLLVFPSNCHISPFLHPSCWELFLYI